MKLHQDRAVDDCQAVVDRAPDETVLVVSPGRDDRVVFGRQVSQRKLFQPVELAIRAVCAAVNASIVLIRFLVSCWI